MKLLSAEQMRALEAAAAAQGLPYAEMMERAGLAVAQEVRERCPQKNGNALVLVGPGNNGGDGLVAAHYLAEWNIAVTVYIWRRTIQPDPNLARVQAQGIPVAWYEQDPTLQQLADLVDRCDVVIDALLGTGATGALRGGLCELLSTVATHLQLGRSALPTRQRLWPSANPDRSRRRQVIAVDLPSGLDADSGEIDPCTLPADVTVTFAHPKRGHMAFPGAEAVGELVVADIGIPTNLAPSGAPEIITVDRVRAGLPPRPISGHKGTFGSVMVVAGSNNYVGAPCLAARAAYRAGAGLVTLATPSSIHSVAATLLPEATHLLLPHSLGALVSDAVDVLGPELPRYQALLVGPGLGRDPRTRQFVADLLAGSRGVERHAIGFAAQPATLASYALPPLVLDADGLNLLAELPSWPQRLLPDAVLTPHPGEMARLLGVTTAEVNARRIDTAREAAQAWHCTVVLKGAFTIVAGQEGEVWVCPLANAALATAGTGDVLAGIIAGLRAQGCPGLDAAVCGVYWHALAGVLWSEEHGAAGLLASELSALLPQARRRLLG